MHLLLYIVDQTFNDTLPYIPIIDIDIIIPKYALTDLEFYRVHLIENLRYLGVKDDFSHTNVETLQRRIADHIKNMTDEEIRNSIIKDIKRAALGSQYTTRPTAQDDIDRQVAQVQNLNNEEIDAFRNTIIGSLLTVDLDTMNSQSSVALQNIAKHEMGHGLGLRDFEIITGQGRREIPLMGFKLIHSYSTLTIPHHTGFYDIFALSCLYNEIRIDIR